MMSVPRHSIEQRRALATLATSGPDGATQAVLSSHGFDASLIAGLVNRGLATIMYGEGPGGRQECRGHEGADHGSGAGCAWGDLTDAMAASPPKPRVSAEQRRALRLLASNCHGVNAALLVQGHGFKRRVLAGLIRRKLAAAEREVAMAGGKAVEVVRIRITAAGQRAMEG